MTITTLSSREFNQDTGKAKKAAKRGPVFITDRGRPAHVLISIEQYQSLAGLSSSIVDLLASPGAEKSSRHRASASSRANERDALIAATALVHGMTVVTRNVAHFESSQVAIVDPWR